MLERLDQARSLTRNHGKIVAAGIVSDGLEFSEDDLIGFLLDGAVKPTGHRAVTALDEGFTGAAPGRTLGAQAGGQH
jgi:hypothetical protein